MCTLKVEGVENVDDQPFGEGPEALEALRDSRTETAARTIEHQTPEAGQATHERCPAPATSGRPVHEDDRRTRPRFLDPDRGPVSAFRL